MMQKRASSRRQNLSQHKSQIRSLDTGRAGYLLVMGQMIVGIVRHYFSLPICQMGLTSCAASV